MRKGTGEMKNNPCEFCEDYAVDVECDNDTCPVYLLKAENEVLKEKVKNLTREIKNLTKEIKGSNESYYNYNEYPHENGELLPWERQKVIGDIRNG